MRLRALALIFASFATLANEAPKPTPRITIAGSTSMADLIEQLSEKYQQKTGRLVDVQSIGSSAGINSVINDVSELGMSSRYLKQEEITPGLETHVIAYDGIIVVVNPSNSIYTLTSEQLKQIYLGNITDWSQVGGKKQAMVAVSRELASGSRFSFESLLDLTKVYKGNTVSNVSPSLLVANSNGIVKTLVANNKNAIGYVSSGSLDANVKALAIDNIPFSVKKLTDGEYKLSRPFLLLHKKGKLSKDSQEFIDFVLSKEGQKLIADMHYIPVVQP